MGFRSLAVPLFVALQASASAGIGTGGAQEAPLAHHHWAKSCLLDPSGRVPILVETRCDDSSGGALFV